MQKLHGTSKWSRVKDLLYREANNLVSTVYPHPEVPLHTFNAFDWTPKFWLNHEITFVSTSRAMIFGPGWWCVASGPEFYDIEGTIECISWGDSITSDNITKLSALICEKVASSKFPPLAMSWCPEMIITIHRPLGFVLHWKYQQKSEFVFKNLQNSSVSFLFHYLVTK